MLATEPDKGTMSVVTFKLICLASRGIELIVENFWVFISYEKSALTAHAGVAVSI